MTRTSKVVKSCSMYHWLFIVTSTIYHIISSIVCDTRDTFSRYTALDGHADRVIYFYLDQEDGEVESKPDLTSQPKKMRHQKCVE